MVKRVSIACWSLVLCLFLSTVCYADNATIVQLFFGLSKPDGGTVSEIEWDNFERNVIAVNFTGFNVVDAKGYWEKEFEQSKIVTLIKNVGDDDNATGVAKYYVNKFNQTAVMKVTINGSNTTVVDKEFIEHD